MPTIKSEDMDRRLIREQLADAVRHVADGVRGAAEQRARVQRLERRGHDVSEARRLLAIVETTLAVRVAERDRLIAQLGKHRSGRRIRAQVIR
jgi:hypothetical protein